MRWDVCVFGSLERDLSNYSAVISEHFMVEICV